MQSGKSKHYYCGVQYLDIGVVTLPVTTKYAARLRMRISARPSSTGTWSRSGPSA
jgi:hypothetical protein